MIDFMCSIFALPFEREEYFSVDNRPFLTGAFNCVKLKCLIDTGASVSCMSKLSFDAIPNHDSLESVPIPPGFRLSAATGHNFSLIGYYQFEFRVLGRVFTRPLFVIAGLSKCEAILGIDFIREIQLCISGDNVFFNNLSVSDNIQCSVISAIEDIKIPPRSVLRVPVSERSARGKKIVKGTYGICSTAFDKLGVWNSLNKVDYDGNIFAVVTNGLDDEQVYKKNEMLGFFQPIHYQVVEVHGISEAQIDEVFSDFSREPVNPHVGASRKPLSEDEKKMLLEGLVIKAPPEIQQKYVDLLIMYHDTCSKSKFDIGRTNVIEHKVVLNNEDPIHIRQFRIPFEHRQTIYNWIDELLKKGAIEVSRSCFNSPIFLVPKPHGHGMRAVLDFREVNNAFVPDWYTIREIRDCVDEIGSAGSKIFSTIDLTSGFWKQSLEESSRQYTTFTVLGKGTRYQWTVTPMGLQGSQASFARLIDYVMRALSGVLTYIDDVLVHTPDHETQLALLEQTLLRLRKYNLKLNVSKSCFGANTVNYLGYTLSGEGIAPGKEKLEAVSKFPAPLSIKQIRELVGLCNYFRFLIPNFAFYSGLLNNLTQQKSGYSGGPLPPLGLSAFSHLKRQLCAAPLVSHPRRASHFTLQLTLLPEIVTIRAALVQCLPKCGKMARSMLLPMQTGR